LNAGGRAEQVHYFADFASVLPATNTIAATPSIAPVANLWNYNLPLAPASPATLSNADAGTVVGWGINGVAGGSAGATDSALLAENATRFYKLNTPLPQVALRNEAEEAKRLSEVTQLTKAQPQVAYQNRAERLALAPQSITAPAAPAQLPADASGLGESLARSQTAGQQLNDSRLAFGNRGTELSRADVNNSQRFFRQAVAPTDGLAANARPLEALVAKKSEVAGAAQVLSEFTVEQQGNSVRLMDFDGSVYAGVIDAPVTAEPEKLQEEVARDKDGFAANRALKEQEARQAGANQAGEYSFRASGSNAALRQLVVVNARFRLGTNANSAVVNQRAFGAAGVGLAREKALAPTGPTAPRRTMERFGRASDSTNATLAIEGTVQVGPTNVQRFIAVPGTRQ
jgi:hypothetical protein